MKICRRSLLEKRRGGTIYFGAKHPVRDAEDFFTSSPSANLAGKKKDNRKFTERCVAACADAPFYIGEIMFEAIMKNNEAVSTSRLSALSKLVMAAGGMTIGVLLMLMGLILWGLSSIEQQNHDGWELILLVSSFVFFGIGAHGFDLLNKAEKEEKKRKLNI